MGSSVRQRQNPLLISELCSPTKGIRIIIKRSGVWGFIDTLHNEFVTGIKAA